MTYIHELCCTFSHGVTLLKTIKLKIIKKNNFHLSKYVVVSLKERYKSKVKEEKSKQITEQEHRKQANMDNEKQKNR